MQKLVEKYRPGIQKILRYLPVKLYLPVFAILLWLGYRWLQLQFTEEPSAFNDLLQLLIQAGKWVIFLLLSFSLFTVLVPYILFLWAHYRQQLQVQISSPPDEASKGRQKIQIEMQPLLQPLMGHLYFRMVYDGERQQSPLFSLVRRENLLGFAGKVQQGWFHWPLLSIREYEVDSMVVYFEDIFHFFSLVWPIKVHQSFYTRPGQSPIESTPLLPTRTQQEDVKIEDWRKVQGELFNYKHFESHDDVRRIVWKIYARNKELMVRTHEIMDPYASHIGMYASYYVRPALGTEGSLQQYCLDYYKTVCWNLYNMLSEQGMQVQYFTDQQLPHHNLEQPKAIVQYQIAVSQWQQTLSLQQWVRPKDAALVCISSFAAPEDVAQLLDNAPHGMSVALVPLSKLIALPKGRHWLRWLWVQEEKDPTKKLQVRWLFSPLRAALQQNEKKLEALIAQSGVKQIEYTNIGTGTKA